jgi:L-lysine 2,3-aminomutase
MATYYANNPAYFAKYRAQNRATRSKITVAAARLRRAEFRRRLRELKSVPCKDCGNEFPTHSMEFDHRDPSSKIKEMSAMVLNSSWERILVEVAKCDIVCVMCHRDRTLARRPLSIVPVWKQKKLDFIKAAKAGPCVDCGQQYLSHQMDFDHVRGVKLANVSRLVNFSLDVIKAELTKCDLVCAFCHRSRTFQEAT